MAPKMAIPTADSQVWAKVKKIADKWKKKEEMKEELKDKVVIDWEAYQ